MISVELWFSDSDSEETNQNEILRMARKRRIIRDASNPFELEEEVFLKHFRLSKIAFKDLLTEIQPKLKARVRNTSISDVLKLAAALQFCAHGSYQSNVGKENYLGLAQSTVSLVLKEVFEVIETNICPKWIKFDYSKSEEHRAKVHFFEKSGIPGIIGCIDGTHIRIASPKKELQHVYCNKKGFYSINAMIVCDDKMIIRCIDARYPGSAHDSHVFNKSALKTVLAEKYQRRERNTWLLGDAAYPLKPYLITPFSDPEKTSKEILFNKKHEKARSVVGRTIGVLKNRFRCLLRARELHYSPKKAAQITNVCAALHNICVTYKIPLVEKETHFDEEESPLAYCAEGVKEELSEKEEAIQIRNEILSSI